MTTDRRPTSIFSSTIPNNVDEVKPTNTQQIQTIAPKPVATLSTIISEDQIRKLGDSSGQSISTISGKILELQKGSNQGVMGDKLDELIKSAKGMSTDNFKSGLVKSVMTKVFNVKYDLMSRFETAKDKVDNLVKELEKEKVTQEQVYHNIEQLIEGNANYCKSLMQEIEAGKQMLQSISDEMAQYNSDKLTIEESRALNDAKERYDLLEKKIVDLESFKVLSINMDPKLTAMKASANSLINTFDMIVGKMVPAYMLYFADYLNAKAQERAVALSNQAMDSFDAIIKESGDLSQKNLENIGKLKNRQLVSVDTIREEHEKMITGLNNLRQIEDQARQDRAKIMVELKDIENKSIEAFSRK